MNVEIIILGHTTAAPLQTSYYGSTVGADSSAREPIIEYIVQFQSTHKRQRVYDSFTRTKFTYVLKFKYFFIPSFNLKKSK